MPGYRPVSRNTRSSRLSVGPCEFTAFRSGLRPSLQAVNSLQTYPQKINYTLHLTKPKPFSHIFKSITSDNGSEFSTLPSILPQTTIYYAHPYSSFERGTNEKQNSLVRRFFPKGKSFDDVSDQAIERVEFWINHLPRKIFHYSSASDLFSRVLFDIAI